MLKLIYDQFDDGELSNSIPYNQISDLSHLFIHNFPEEPFSFSAQTAAPSFVHPTELSLHPPKTQIDGEMPISSRPPEALEITGRQDL